MIAGLDLFDHEGAVRPGGANEWTSGAVVSGASFAEQNLRSTASVNQPRLQAGGVNRNSGIPLDDNLQAPGGDALPATAADRAAVRWNPF